MPKPLYITLEKSSAPTLIIDKEGSIGIGIYSKLKDVSSIVLVGGKKPVEEENNFLFLFYKSEIPQIPAESYAQIFYVVHSEKELKDLHPALLEKAKHDKSKFFIIGSRDILSLSVLDNIFTNDNEVSVILLGDLFGNPLFHRKKGSIEGIFDEAKSNKAITLPGVGLSKIYPVFFDDAVIELVRLTFTHNKKNRLYFLHTQYPITLLGLSHILQKEDPLLKIDFERNELPAREDSTPIEGEYLLSEDYPAAEKIRKSYNGHKKEEEPNKKNINDEIIGKKQKKIKFDKSPWINLLVVFLIFTLSFAMLPFLALSSLGFLSAISIQQSFKSLESGNFSSAKTQVFVSGRLISVAKQTLPVFSSELSLLGIKNNFFAKDSFLNIQTAIDDVEKLLQVSDSIKAVMGSGVNQSFLLNSIASVRSLFVTAQQMINDKTVPDVYKNKLVNILNNAKLFINVLDTLPYLLGENGKKTYLILFQNNAELRPGGGFIGSYGILTFNNGNIKDFSIHDVYDADGQLKGHIEPPFPIRRYLPQVHLYLRDSNFDVDFTKNAFMAAFLYDQEMHQKVDGVIGVDLSFVRDLIGSVGNLYIPTYKETVTKNNFFSLAESHSEKNFFPGSSQKKDFLNSVFSVLQNKFASGKGINYLNLLDVISSASREKHLLFAFADNSVQDVFTANGFSSTLWDNRQSSLSTINDFLGINEANLGIDKVNYYVSRKVSQKVSILQNGEIDEEASIDITNSSSGQIYTGGYKTYIRFILPENSLLTKVVINGVEEKIVPAVTDFLRYESKNFVPPSGLEVEKTEESGKTIYGFLTDILPKQSQTITISYTLGSKVDLSSPKITYSNIYFKQPGTDTYPLSFYLNIPKTFKAINYNNLKLQNLGLYFNGDVEEDKKVSVVFSKI